VKSNFYLLAAITCFTFILMVSLVVTLYLSDGKFLYGDAYNFISYRKNILSGTNLFDLGTINVFVVSMVYSSDPTYNLLVNVSIYIISLIFIFRNTSRIESVSLYILLLVLTSASIFTRMVEPSREYILLLVFFLAALHRQKKDRLVYILLLIIIISIRPVYIVALPFVILKTSYAAFITVLLCYILSQDGFEMPRFITLRVADYKGDFSNNFIMTTMLNFFGGINGWMTDAYPMKDRLIIFCSYVQRLVALGLIFFLDRLAFLHIFLFAVTLAVILQFPHPRYLEPLIFFFLGKLYIERQYASIT